MLQRFFAREEGQGLVEYCLIVALIAVIVIAILALLIVPFGPSFGSSTRN